MNSVFQLGDRVTLFPVIHGSGDFAIQIRRLMLEQRFDCLAVPLPPSFQVHVEQGIGELPAPSIVVQPEALPISPSSWVGQAEEDQWDDDDLRCSFVPIDPCQPVIAAIRAAIGEHIPRAFIDLETRACESFSEPLPDPYALKRVASERFAAAILPAISPPASDQQRARIRHMAVELQRLGETYKSILCVCSMDDWPWLRQAYGQPPPQVCEEPDCVEPTSIFSIDPQTLIFFLGELPFITSLYERARAELDNDENLSVDGVKELLLAARDAYRRELKSRARRITPQTLTTCLKYIRNLTLIDRRLTPDLYSIVVAAKQTVGDGYALTVTETARHYDYGACPYPLISMGIEQLRMPDGEIRDHVSRLPGPPLEWRSCELRRRPSEFEKKRWSMQWNPFAQCSWPPEDDLIENFRAHVTNRALAIMGADLAKTEKFSTSIQDGIDIRDTLRNWHTGDIYVKVLPPNRGTLDAAVMLFESPADPRDYPWRTTWFAEHQNESTLSFFATDFRQELVGPGIGLATYGGALFLFPPRSIPDIWQDPQLDFTETMEERLLAAACLHSSSPHVSLLAAAPPGAGWRRLANRFRKKWVHVPLHSFSDSTIQQLRMVHVLNGRQVRSFASHFIRKS